MALIITTHLWGATKYGLADVVKVSAGVRRHISEPYRFVLITDDNSRGLELPERHNALIDAVWKIPEQDEHLLDIQGCFARLRLFDPTWQALHGIGKGDRIVSIDLDVVVTGPLHPLFYRQEEFLILQGANSSNPCPFNGSLWMCRAGYRPDVWSDFSLDAAAKVPHDRFPDDQAWLAHKLPEAAGWKAGSSSGIYAFQKPGWPKGDDLPADARLVVFPGWRSPAKFKRLPWIKENWAA